MSIEIICTQCGAQHQVNDRLSGRRVRCPDCDTHVVVPTAAIPDASLDPGSGISDVDIADTDEIEIAESETAEAEPVDAVPAQPVTAKPVMAVASVGAQSGGVTGNPPAINPPDDEDEDDDEVLPRGNRPEEEMDMTPMVDVTFLLLIFFMVTAAFSLQKSINMPRQQTDAPSMNNEPDETEDLDMVDLEVDEFGSFLVMAPDWERETPGKQNLISALREALAGNKDGMRLAIKVHEMAKLRALVDAMDAGTIAGFAQLEVTQVEDFD